jgi:hypothetical protein
VAQSEKVSNGPIQCDSLDIGPEENERYIHPITGKFLFEYDRARSIIVVFDKGIAAEIDLTGPGLPKQNRLKRGK